MNERQLKPLRKYEVYTFRYGDMGQMDEVIETFTGDNFVREEDGSVVFYNTGNVIRVYMNRPNKIIVTPVDPAEVPE